VEQLGKLRFVRRYPVKAMAGEDLQEVRMTYAGLVGDRVYAFVENENRSSFPWMTGRLGHEMILYRPRFVAGPAPAEGHPRAEQYAAEVTTPEREVFRLEDARFTRHLEKRFGRPLTLRFSERSMQDACPVSLIGLRAIDALGEEAGLALDDRRFRANFYVEWVSPEPFYEDQLVGRTLEIGEEAAVVVVKKDSRCKIITLDPETAAAAPQVLGIVARHHGGCTGVYASVLREGVVRAGDAVRAGGTTAAATEFTPRCCESDG
jgi:uncharacterized protein